MTPFTTYNSITGKIWMTGVASNIYLQIFSTEQAVIEGESNPVTDYVDLTGTTPEIKPRPQLTVLPSPQNRVYNSVVDADTFVIDMSGFPAGTTVSAINENGESVYTNDPEDPIILVDPEVYTITVTPPFPYFKLVQELEVV